MTIEPREAGWRDLAEQAVGDVEPSEFTDRRILKEAARIAAERRAEAARTGARRRWLPAAMVASVALVALGLGFAVVPARGPGGDTGTVVPADAGSATIAPTMAHVDVPLQFAGDRDTVSRVDQDQIAAAVSQIDPCGADVRLRLDTVAAEALADRRARAVTAVLAQISGGRCHPHVVAAHSGGVVAGANAVLVIAHAPPR